MRLGQCLRLALPEQGLHAAKVIFRVDAGGGFRDLLDVKRKAVFEET